MDTHPDEHLIFEGHPSWRSILSFYFKGIGLAIVLGGIGYLVKDGGGAALGAGAVFLVLVLVGLLKRVSTTYSISNQRLHIRRGIVARKIQETRMERVQNVNINQGALQRILQIGTVDFDTAGSGDSDFSFAGVAQPEEVLVKVEQAQREYNESMRQGQVAPPGPQTSV